MAADDTLSALNEIHGQTKPDDVGIGAWIWGALQGDFNGERSAGQIGFDMVVSLIPVVDTICDLRDLVANLRNYRKDPTNKITVFFIATTVVGFIPEIGTVVKSALRLLWVYLKPLIKRADDLMNENFLIMAANRACDAALPKITEYLQHNRVANWATNGKLPDVYKFISKTIAESLEKIDPGKIKHVLNGKLDDLKTLLEKIRPIVPGTIREQIDDLFQFIGTARTTIGDSILWCIRPVKTILRVFAKRLDDHAWRVETYRTNRGWVAPISASGSARLINAEPPPWVKPFKGTLEHPPLELNSNEADAFMKQHPDFPRLNHTQLATFSNSGKGIYAEKIIGPAKLYRVIDPSNEGAGMFWISEAEYKTIKDRDMWRSRFAIKSEWNQNGWVVEYEVKVGETLAVWRGPAASQKLVGTSHYLEGSGEQIVFYPGSRDEMINAMPRIDKKSGDYLTDGAGNLDRRIEFTDLTGEIVPVKLRARITDSHISGPIETGWGATDYTPQESKRILLTAPIRP